MFLFHVRAFVDEEDYDGLLAAIEAEDTTRYQSNPHGETALQALTLLRDEVVQVRSAMSGGIGGGFERPSRLESGQRITHRAEWYADMRYAFEAKVDPEHQADLEAQFQREKNKKAAGTRRNEPVKRQAEAIWRKLYEDLLAKNPAHKTTSLLKLVEQYAARYEAKDPKLRTELNKSPKTIGRRLRLLK